jgi:hypothetical protein
MMNQKGCGRKWSWPNLRCTYYSGTCLVGLRKTTKNFNQDNRSPGRDSNLVKLGSKFCFNINLLQAFIHTSKLVSGI